MKKMFFVLLTLFPFAIHAQTGYYTPAEGYTGQALRLALCNIIRPHTVLSYTPGLWTAYLSTDVKPNGKLWDIYSDRPGGIPAYEYTMTSDQCGSVSPSAEGGCYNREHTWPQSKFSSDTPMQTDLFLVYPTDYYVNNRRGDDPYGKVGSVTETFTNGAKLGSNTYPGASIGLCYEPIDSFKGDIARTYFYISTCYRNDSAKFDVWQMATRVNLNPWAAQMLLDWHHMDPVSKKEIDRNNAVYSIQGNRNPFIDHPEYADCIWGTATCSPTHISTVNEGSSCAVIPNPASNVVTLSWSQSVTSGATHVAVYSINGNMLLNSTYTTTNTTIDVATWPRGIYIVRMENGSTTNVQKLVLQ